MNRVAAMILSVAALLAIGAWTAFGDRWTGDGAPVAALLVAHADGETTPDVDDLGRFSCPITPGPVRVVVDLDGGPRVATSWVVAPRP